MTLLIVLTGAEIAAEDLSKKLVVPAEDTVQMLTVDDGSMLVGRITEVGADEIKFKTDLGEMTIAVSKIRKVVEVPASSFKKGQYWFPNPNVTRLLVGPTA